MMFEINQKQNKMSPMQECKFSELGIKERDHFQEWLVNKPDALGEDLLIIQKEFDGFAETKERLDILALDKSGRLVIIENKLDDTGKNVVWQALKYVAFCSSLKTSEIIKIFQDYLHKQNRSDDAGDVICEFLEEESIEDVSLNRGNNQRFILVAADFRKEVTSTVLWLLSNDIQVRCMKAIPYKCDEKLFLAIYQIIPTPEAEDYMISMSSKDSEEKHSNIIKSRQNKLCLAFWEEMIDYLHQKNFILYQNVNPYHRSWLNAGAGISGCSYRLIFRKKEVRVQFSIMKSTVDETNHIFDFLSQSDKKIAIENRFENELEWKKLNDSKTSWIRFSKDFDSYDKASWPEMRDWLFVHIQKLEKAFKPVIPELKSYVKD